MAYRNINDELAYNGFTKESYEQFLQACADKYEGISDKSWQDIADEYDVLSIGDSIRRTVTPALIGSYYVRQFYLDKMRNMASNQSLDSVNDIEDLLQELEQKRQEIYKEKQKLSDERTALNRRLREEARLEADLDYLHKCIVQRGKNVLFNGDEDRDLYRIHEWFESDEATIVCLSDLHLGLTTDNNFGKYDLDIAKRRLENYLLYIDAIDPYTENCYVFLLGDLISGGLHTTIKLEEREQAIEQTQIASELIANFVYELSLKFKNVYVNGVAGNHSRIGFKDEVLRNNRLDNIVPWYMKASLKHVENIHFIDEQNIDPTIGSVEILGNTYWLVHGDFDSFDKKGISNLVLQNKQIPAAIFYGHLHSCSYQEIAGVQMVRSGSLCGTSDNYTVQNRISGIPSQMVCIVDDNGISSLHPVKLK